MHWKNQKVGLILTIGLLLVMLPQSVDATPSRAPSLAVVTPGASGVVLPELDEFATTVMGDPWDMNEPTDLAFYRWESSITNSQFSNGMYSGQMTAGDGRERITLLTAGAPNNEAMRVGKIGYTYPINADYYRYLTFRMYSSNTNCNSGLIQWFADDSYSTASTGVSNGFLVPPTAAYPCTNQQSGWFIYTFDLKTIGIQQGSKTWSGTIRELLIHPFAGTGAAGATVKLDWARLTAVDPRTARPYTIQWTGNGNGGPVTLYASPDNTTLDADDIVVATNQSARGGSFDFQTGVLPAGRYYSAASNSNGTAWSSGPLTINAPPQVTITKPSMTSGQDYAAAETGKGWDMSDATDLDLNTSATGPTCVTNPSFSNGIFSATIPNPICPSGSAYADPKLYLGRMDRFPAGTLDPIVDTNKYRYLSYRLNHSGQQDVRNGWVVRFGWWQMSANDTFVTNPVMSRDIMILEGWNTYKADLWAADVVDESYPPGTPNWQQSHPNRLRFDPDELAAALAPATIQLDWIKLTAMDEVTRGASFPIEYALNATGPVMLTFYYDTDTNPSNGRTLIGTSQVSAPSQNPHVRPPLTSNQTFTLFLPLVLRNAVSCTTTCLVWDTAAVSPATYYICIQSQDAYNTTYRCSEAPLIVR